MEKAQTTGSTNEGMMKKMDAGQRPVNYVMVESVDDFSKKIRSLDR